MRAGTRPVRLFMASERALEIHSPAELDTGPIDELSSKLNFPVVGVGASAGGIDAFIALLENLPPDPGIAFILILHLDPHRESMVTSILGRSTRMPVREA